MSCEDCIKYQAENKSAFFRFRWGNANIEMRGCYKHLKEIFEVLRFWQNASYEGKIWLLLRPESWENLFLCIRNSTIKSEGNFWAAVQELERQFQERQNLMENHNGKADTNSSSK